MLRLPAVFGEHMVLQRGKPIVVFGEADGPVEVEIGGKRAGAACENGRFRAWLPPMEAGGPYTMTVRRGAEMVTCGDVRIGEVWLCGGQSNMEFRLQDERHFEAANCKSDVRVRFYEVPQAATVKEAERMEPGTRWQVLEAGKCAGVSAVAFYAACELAGRLDVAVGMIICCIGGTSASCWMSRETLAAFPEGAAFLDDFKRRIKGKTDAQFDQECGAYQRRVDAYNAAVAALKRENPAIPWTQINERAGMYPWPPPFGRTMLRRPGGPYETMLSRIAPYTLRGFFYYQGEQDAALQWAKGYEALLKRLISQWRALFKDESLFFAAAQLPRYGADAAVENWAAVRAAQQAVIDGDEHAALACLLDCGERDNVHPTDKRVPGGRLAALALAHVYGQDVQADAPRVIRAGFHAGRVILETAHTGGELAVRGDALCALHVEGARLRSVSTDEKGIALTLEAVQARVRVRYAQQNWPEVAFFAQNGLPLFPFDLAFSKE